MAVCCSELVAYLKTVDRRILEYILSSDVAKGLEPADIKEGVLSYVQRPGKRMRPGLLLMACGSVGGEEREAMAVPAAAGVELFHTWTLVHDDVIDNDGVRRGQPTVHEAMTQKAKAAFGFDDALATEYGRDIAILTGDVQHGWSVTCFLDCALRMGADPLVILQVVKYLQSYVVPELVRGEVLDVQSGMKKGTDVSDIDEDKIIHMLRLKTGVLYEFAAMAGALIGKNTTELDDPQVQALRLFASNCGAAFQLQDDVLGVVGNEKTLGKPVGSDIREGKMTVVVCHALRHANENEKARILSVLGNRAASPDAIAQVTALLEELGGVERCRALARGYIDEALPYLDDIEESGYRRLLVQWAEFMINRES